MYHSTEPYFSAFGQITLFAKRWISIDLVKNKLESISNLIICVSSNSPFGKENNLDFCKGAMRCISRNNDAFRVNLTHNKIRRKP